MSPEGPSTEDATSSGQAKRILVVDDEKQVLAALEDLLEDQFSVISTTSAKDAIKIAEDDPSLAVILTDQRMPGMTGDELLARIRQVSSATRVLITGYADFDAVVHAINDGKVFAYVSKPWDPDGLRLTLGHAADMFRLNQKLMEETSYLNALMTNVPDAIYFKDREHRYLRMNLAEARLMGFATPEEGIGLSANDFLPPERRQQRIAEETRLFETGIHIRDRVERVVNKDDSVSFYAANKAPLRDEHGHITGLVGVTRDITALKQNEQKLELLLQVTDRISAADSTSEAIAGVLEAMSRSMEWDIGEAWHLAEDRETLMPYSGHYLSSPDLAPFVEAVTARGIKRGAGMPGRVWESGTYEWLEDVQAKGVLFIRAKEAADCGIHSAFSLPVFGDGKKIVAVLTFFGRNPRPESTYIVEQSTAAAVQVGQTLSRRFVEERLHRTETKFQTIMEETQHGVFVMRDFQLLFVNTAFARIFGYASREDAMARETLLAFFHPDEHARVMEYNRLRKAGEFAPAEFRVRGVKADGREIVLVNRVARIPWEEGMATWGNMVDVSDQIAMEAQLQQAQKMDALGQLTGGIAHDFNNLLTVINGNLELISRRLANEEDVKLSRWVNTARRAGRRGGDLTARLLAFSRRQVLEPTVLRLNETITGMEDMLVRSLGENIEISVIAGATNDLVKVDPGQLESAVLNLSVNARDAMPDGGKLTIETDDAVLDADYARQHTDVTPGRYAMIAVTDTGTGMPPDLIKKVFEPFFTTKEQGKGTGLGLAMIYGFIKQSGGHINLYSEVGHGTTFRLYLPLHAGEGVLADVDTAERGEMAAIRILLAEDNEDVRDTAQNLLEAMGHELVLAENGPAALAILERDQAFDLLMTDIVMPGGMTGIDLAGVVRARWPDIRVLFTSGYAEEAIRKSNAGASNGVWLAKPYTAQHLREKIAEALANGQEKV